MTVEPTFGHRTASRAVLVLALALMVAGMSLAAAPPIAADEHAVEGGSGQFEGTEIEQDETFLGPCGFETERSVYGLGALGSYDGWNDAGERVSYEAQNVGGGADLWEEPDGPLRIEVENTEPYFHGPNGTVDADCENPGTRVPAQFRIHAATGDPLEPRVHDGADGPCVGHGEFWRDADANFAAEWTLDSDCVVEGNDAGRPGSGIAPAGTEHALEGEHIPNEAPNITGDYQQALAVLPAEPGAIAGAVTDADSGEALGGAQVTAVAGDGTETSATTGADGAYAIDGLDAGDYAVTATADGYEPATADDVAVAEGETTTVDLALTSQEIAACGRVITEDTVLDHDIGPCDDGGLVVDADDVTLDLGGHTVRGTDERGDGVGVLLVGRSGVTVTGGRVTAFDAGVGVIGGSGNAVTGIEAVDNVGSGLWGDGIAVDSSTDNTVADNLVVGNGPYSGVGIFGATSTGNVIDGNEIRDNDGLAHPTQGPQQTDGVRLEPGTTNSTVTDNVVHGSGLDGIAIFSRSHDNVVTGNDVADNGAHDRPHRLGSGIIAFAGSSGNVIEANTLTGNAANGIVLRGPVGDVAGSEDNEVVDNVALGNAALQDEAPESSFYDIRDDNFEPPCDNNLWSGNTFELFNQECVTADGLQLPAVDGSVTDADTGGAIAGAAVTLAGGDTETTASTGDEGGYLFQDVDAGDYTVTMSAEGYEDQARDVTVSAQELTTADFALVPEPRDPEHRDDCMDGGWQDYGFDNQGRCMQFVHAGRDPR